jgi:extradiol dioxygenase family protein
MNAFHISFPVKDRYSTQEFYTQVLGAIMEKDCDTRLHMSLAGHDLTFRVDPAHITADKNWHWGINVHWEIFQDIYHNLQAHQVQFEQYPKVLDAGSPEERVKMSFYDPNGYLLEYKAQRYGQP